MRVALISCNGRARDAIGNHLAQKLSFFQDQGADVQVFLQSLERLHPALSGHVQQLDSAPTSGPAWEFLSHADLVIVDLAQDYELLALLPLLADGKPRLVVDYHGITPPHLWETSGRHLLHRGLKQRGLVWCADYVWVHSRFMRQDLLQATGFPDQHIGVIDFPVSEEFYPGQPKQSLRTRLGLHDARLLLFVGRLAVNKRVPVLIEAVALLRERQPNVHALIVGAADDVYQLEAERCRALAEQRGVASRIHWLGPLSDTQLADAYRDADLLVIPSVHEGFCIPVLEAMASGLPVIGARAAALPETLGLAGLSFKPDDPHDLARQIKRVFPTSPSLYSDKQKQETSASEPQSVPAPSPQPQATRRRVALVSFRFGAEIVGGAETSLRKIGLALQKQGVAVEVFTTCTRAEGDWTNELPAGTVQQDGLVIHRFPLDAHHRERHLESVRQILHANGHVAAELEQTYLEHSIHSSPLLATLDKRINDFAALITGPYLFGLTHDVARAFPAKTLLLSCFHHEPLARLKAWPEVYNQVGGVLYHSPEERELAQSELGINHPNSVEIGTFLMPPPPVFKPFPSQKPYLVYCGRYSRQKELPRLLDFAARYQKEQPGRFHWLFMGKGEVVIPRAPWSRDLGPVDEQTKQAVLAGAAALVQLSLQESLSLVILEAWAHGTPVLVERRCPVLAGQIKRSGGGRAIADYPDFARCLDEMWADPKAWQQFGRQGQLYVHNQYANENAFAAKVLDALRGLQVPLRDKMIQRGLERATHCTRAAWRTRLGQLIEQVLDAGPRACRSLINITLAKNHHQAKAGTRTLLIPVRLENAGTHALAAEGPGRTELCCQIDGQQISRTPLPGLLLPGKTQTVAAVVAVPEQKGEYRMYFWVNPEERQTTSTLTVGAAGPEGCTGPFLEATHEALLEVQKQQRLPDGYHDVTEGWGARLKRWIKSKLLGNFKRGYIDVLSRQQSEVNQQVLTALQQLTECCATLDHAVRGLQERIDRMEIACGSDNLAKQQTADHCKTL